jgi:hypothetical protein
MGETAVLSFLSSFCNLERFTPKFLSFFIGKRRKFGSSAEVNI